MDTLTQHSVLGATATNIHDGTRSQDVTERNHFYGSLFAHGALIFDVGANTGKKATTFLQFGAGKIVCFEPQPHCAEAIRRISAQMPEIVVVEKGLSDRDGMMTLSICSQADTISTFSEQWKTGRFSGHQWDRKAEVAVTTLENMIQEFGLPEFCKIDVEGYEYEVLNGLKSLIPCVSFEFTREGLHNADLCMQYLDSLGYREYNVGVGEVEQLALVDWVSSETLLTALRQSSDSLLWGDIYARCVTPAGSDLDALRQAGLWQDGQPLRLHLGCGEQLFPGYINIDYPQSEHNVMAVKPEVYADITKIDMPANSVDEIRLHHVFEHFNRVTALAMLIRWHRWLKPGGKLHIETPDLAGSVKTLASAAPYKNKMSVVRHLAGDQAASWAYHLDHWFPERYQRTLEKLGFASVQTASQTWPHEPHLSNVTAVACKLQDRSEADQLAAADELLWDSIVSPSEQTTFDVWRHQLRALVSAGALQPSGKFNPPAMNIGANHVAALQQNASQLPLAEIYGFNQSDRDKWVAGRAATVPTGSRVLDIGAGTCPYRSLFAHCDYRTHDFMQYEGVKLGGTAEYGKIDYVSDVAAIPAPDNFFDVILCTEVLEHVPEPIEALREMSRLLRPGGRLFVSAPLGSGLHQLPYHYYGGYTPGWYQHFGTTFGLDIKEISPNGGFFKLLAQECARVAWTLPSHQHLHGEHLRDVQQLFGDLLPRYLFGLEEQQMISQFTVGYHVEAVKSRDVSAIQAQIDQDSTNVALYAEAALAAVASGNLGDSLRYYEDACELNIDDSSLANLHFYFQTTKAGK